MRLCKGCQANLQSHLLRPNKGLLFHSVSSINVYINLQIYFCRKETGKKLIIKCLWNCDFRHELHAVIAAARTQHHQRLHRIHKAIHEEEQTLQEVLSNVHHAHNHRVSTALQTSFWIDKSKKLSPQMRRLRKALHETERDFPKLLAAAHSFSGGGSYSSEES